MIDARDLVVRMGNRRVLERVSLRVDPGEVVGVIGPPEAGKSVLLKTLAGLAWPEEGTLRWGGGLVDARSLATFQREVGMSFQNDALFDTRSVYENVAFALRRRGEDNDSIHGKVTAQLASLGLSQAKDRFPNELSGGMRKRVGIARALVVAPSIGLFDDPIAGLDPFTAAQTLSLLLDAAARRRMAAVIVSNELSLVLPALHRVVMLCDGKVVYDGSSADIAQARAPEVAQFVTGSDEGPL